MDGKIAKIICILGKVENNKNSSSKFTHSNKIDVCIVHIVQYHKDGHDTDHSAIQMQLDHKVASLPKASIVHFA